MGHAQSALVAKKAAVAKPERQKIKN